MKRSIKDVLVAVALNAGAWGLGILFFKWQGDGTGVAANYGIIAGWGFAMYVASINHSRVSGFPWSILLYLLWTVVQQRGTAEMPMAMFAVVLLGRALVFASPILLNWFVEQILLRIRHHANRAVGH